MRLRKRIGLLLVFTAVAVLALPGSASAGEGVRDMWYLNAAHGVVHYNWQRGSFAWGEMAVRDNSADGWCAEVWFDWTFDPGTGHDDATGLRVCGVGEVLEWPRQHEFQQHYLNHLTGIRTDTCLWSYSQKRRHCWSGWAELTKVIPFGE